MIGRRAAPRRDRPGGAAGAGHRPGARRRRRRDLRAHPGRGLPRAGAPARLVAGAVRRLAAPGRSGRRWRPRLPWAARDVEGRKASPAPAKFDYSATVANWSPRARRSWARGRCRWLRSARSSRGDAWIVGTGAVRTSPDPPVALVDGGGRRRRSRAGLSRGRGRGRTGGPPGRASPGRRPAAGTSASRAPSASASATASATEVTPTSRWTCICWSPAPGRRPDRRHVVGLELEGEVVVSRRSTSSVTKVGVALVELAAEQALRRSRPRPDRVGRAEDGAEPAGEAATLPWRPPRRGDRRRQPPDSLTR